MNSREKTLPQAITLGVDADGSGTADPQFKDQFPRRRIREGREIGQHAADCLSRIPEGVEEPAGIVQIPADERAAALQFPQERFFVLSQEGGSAPVPSGIVRKPAVRHRLTDRPMPSEAFVAVAEIADVGGGVQIPVDGRTVRADDSGDLPGADPVAAADLRVDGTLQIVWFFHGAPPFFLPCFLLQYTTN